MGKIEEWEEIAEKIEESLLFEAEMSFEEKRLITPLFTQYEEENSESISGGEAYIKKYAGELSAKDIFLGEAEGGNASEEGRYAEEMLYGAGREAAAYEEDENAAMLYGAGREAAAYEEDENAAMLYEAGREAAAYEEDKNAAMLYEEKIREAAEGFRTEDISAYVLGGENTEEGPESIYFSEGTEAGPEYETEERGGVGERYDLIALLYGEYSPKDDAGGEYDAGELLKMIYEEEKALGTERKSAGGEYINEIYTAGRMGRSTAKRIIESASEKGGSESREVKIEMVNNNNISSDTDIDAVADMLTMKIFDIMNRSADGIY